MAGAFIDGPVVLDIPDGLQRDGQDAVEALALGAPARMHRVFDGQGMQAQFIGQLDELALGRTGQPNTAELPVTQPAQPLEDLPARLVLQNALHGLRPAGLLLVHDAFRLLRMLRTAKFMHGAVNSRPLIVIDVVLPHVNPPATPTGRRAPPRARCPGRVHHDDHSACCPRAQRGRTT
ncbi:hypothetical protein ACFWAX_29130, partial [Streptomyces sp. NPDC059956]